MSANDRLPLVPFPSSARRVADDALALPDELTIVAPDAAAAVADTLAADLCARTGIVTHVVVATDADDVDPEPRASIALVLADGSPEEGYALDTSSPAIALSASTPRGLFYAAQTLLQLVVRADEGWGVLPAVVEDAPRFAYRGAMLDVARHFFDPHDIRLYIDHAASLKLNHLHLHLTDDQGWRLAIERRPALAEKAALSSADGDPGGHLSHEEYRELVAYAASRFVTLVPEIDTPGHTHAVSTAYPEVMEQPVLTEQMHGELAIFGHSAPVFGETFTGYLVGHSSVKIHDPATWEFLDDVFREVVELTPGPFVHVGGDEALGTPPEDFAAFMGRVTRLVAELGKTPVAWHEAGASTTLAPGTIGQFWGATTPTPEHAEHTRSFVEQGGRVIFSPSNAVYLDMKYDENTEHGLTWAGYIPVRTAYEWDPAAIVEGVDDEHILGVEAPLWSETLPNMAAVEALAFPRIAAVAEVAWSPRVADERSWDSFRARTAELSRLWSDAGIAFSARDEIDWPAA